MNGKWVAGFIVIAAILFGGALYYNQEYAFYDRVSADASAQDIVATTFSGSVETLLAERFEGVDAPTSPIKFRACFSTPLSTAMMTETFVPYEKAEPLIAPRWFDCFDAKKIGADIENGRAFAFLGEENITYGIDRVIAVYPDGTAFAWNQINHCGEAVFDGDPAPEGCPAAPAQGQ